MKFDDYVLDYIPRAVKHVLRKSGADEISLLGYCIGGTLTSIFLALHPNMPVRNAVFITSPFDFTDADLFTNWLHERYFQLDLMVDTLGNIPAETIDFGNKLLKLITNFVGPYVSLADRIEDEEFVEN